MESATAERTTGSEVVDRQRGGRVFGAWLAGLLLAGVSVVVACRVADSDGITPVPQLLAFLPWLLAPTGIGLVLALFARWRIGMAWGVVVLAGIAWFIEPYGKDNEAHGAALAELRVMTSNVEFGRGTPALIKAVRRERPDIVFVEECDAAICFDVLDDTFGGPHGTYPYRQAVVAAGSEGSVILSRYPLKAADGVSGTMGMPGAVAEVRGHSVGLQLAHPMPPLPGQVGLWRHELGALRAYAAGSKGATILAGDFNASQDHAAFRRVLDTGLHDSARLAGDARSPSWPSSAPPPLGAQIDHVLVSSDFSVNKATFLHVAGSDHRALVVDLTLHRRG